MNIKKEKSKALFFKKYIKKNLYLTHWTHPEEGGLRRYAWVASSHVF